MSEAADVAKHTPEWLEALATRLHESDTLGADGIAYALEWAAWDIRTLERRVATAIDTSAATIVGLKVEIRRLDHEINRLKKRQDQGVEEGAWS
jgi:hypothetical protein